MEAKELRIGNCVEYQGNTCTIFELGMRKGRIKALLYPLCSVKAIPDFDTNLEDIKPIPLTEQHLKDFGFEYDEDTESWTLLTSLEKIDYAMDVSELPLTFAWRHITIKYVHQLQNLYFALTDNELTLKENG